MPNYDQSSYFNNAYVRIIEQPASKSMRFRYRCEGKSGGSIPGIKSTFVHKTYPTIQVFEYKGKAKVVVSCVTSKSPYRPHPHNVVSKEGSKYGVYTKEIPEDTMILQFRDLGIQCVKKREIVAELTLREEKRIDPFRTGFSHKYEAHAIDLTSVRLCFQVFLKDINTGRYVIPLRPVVSDPIYNRKASSDLVIVKLSHCVTYADARKEIILLCEKIVKEDIKVRFFEEQQGVVVWENYANFHPSNVHKQTAIAFKPPRYYNLDIEEPVQVFIQLKRPSDGVTSEPLKFVFLPLEERKRKRPKLEESTDLRNVYFKLDTSEFANAPLQPLADANPPWNIPFDMMQASVNQLPSRGDLTTQNQNIPYIQNILQPISMENMEPNDQGNLLDLDSNAQLNQIGINSDLYLLE